MSCTGKNAEILKEIQAKHRAEDAAAPALTQQRKVGSGEWMDGQPSRAELISVIAALIEPRVGGDKKAQLARARQAAGVGDITTEAALEICKRISDYDEDDVSEVELIIHAALQSAQQLQKASGGAEDTKRLRDALSALKSACEDVLLPTINKAIECGFKMETWVPEQMQWAKAVELADAALASHERTEEDKIQHGPHGTTYSL